MHIAIHAGTLRGAGSSSVGKNLIRSLARVSGDHRILAWVPEEWEADIAPVELRTTTRRFGEKARLEWHDLPRAIRRERVDRLLSLGDTSTPRPGIPHVLFVQQALLAHAERDWGFAATPRLRSKFALMKAYLRLGKRGVTRFVVQTEDMRNHLADLLGIQLDRVAVIPSAVSDDVRALAKLPSPADGARPYVCYLSNAGPHKNHGILIDMMAVLSTRHPKLTCKLTIEPGQLPDFERAAERRGVRDSFELLGALGRKEALALLHGTHVAVIPSVLESFGIVYYEALALGRPIVAADRGFAREACGDSARYAAPFDGEAFAMHVDELLGGSLTEMADRARARFRIVDVSWEDISIRFLRLLEGLDR